MDDLQASVGAFFLDDRKGNDGVPVGEETCEISQVVTCVEVLESEAFFQRRRRRWTIEDFRLFRTLRTILGTLSTTMQLRGSFPICHKINIIVNYRIT